MKTWIWIEGHDTLRKFCKRRFNEDRIEWRDGTVGYVGVAVAYLAYKMDGEGHYREFYMLTMDVPDNSAANGRIRNLCSGTEMYDLRHSMTYEQIKADPTSVLRQRG